jgi:hypothetical protein
MEIRANNSTEISHRASTNIDTILILTTFMNRGFKPKLAEPLENRTKKLHLANSERISAKIEATVFIQIPIILRPES